MGYGAKFAEGRDSLAQCDRCKLRFPYLELRPDGDQPGLRVCGECWDPIDPWKLPPREPEAISLRFPRPEEPLTAGDVSFSATAGAGSTTARIVIGTIDRPPVEGQLREFVVIFRQDTVTVALRGVRTTVWNNHSGFLDVLPALPALPVFGDSFEIVDEGTI